MHSFVHELTQNPSEWFLYVKWNAYTIIRATISNSQAFMASLALHKLMISWHNKKHDNLCLVYGSIPSHGDYNKLLDFTNWLERRG